MKNNELALKTEDELQAILLVSKKELFNLRFQAVRGELQSTGRIRQLRRLVARVKTWIRTKKG